MQICSAVSRQYTNVARRTVTAPWHRQNITWLKAVLSHSPHTVWWLCHHRIRAKKWRPLRRIISQITTAIRSRTSTSAASKYSFAQADEILPKINVLKQVRKQELFFYFRLCSCDVAYSSPPIAARLSKCPPFLARENCWHFPNAKPGAVFSLEIIYSIVYVLSDEKNPLTADVMSRRCFGRRWRHRRSALFFSAVAVTATAVGQWSAPWRVFAVSITHQLVPDKYHNGLLHFTGQLVLNHLLQ